MDLRYKETIRQRRKPKRIDRDLSHIPKYIVIAILVVFFVFLFLNQRGSNKSFSEVEEAVIAQVDTVGLERADDQAFKRYYGLTASEYDGVMLYVSTFNLEASEILLVKVQSDEQMREVERAIEARISNRQNDFQGYLPEQELLLEEALITIRGDYIFLAISKHADDDQRAFLRAL